MESKMDEVFTLFLAFVNSSKTNPPTNVSLLIENVHDPIGTQEVGAHVDPILEKPIIKLDANFESQKTSANHEKVSR